MSFRFATFWFATCVCAPVALQYQGCGDSHEAADKGPASAKEDQPGDAGNQAGDAGNQAGDAGNQAGDAGNQAGDAGDQAGKPGSDPVTCEESSCAGPAPGAPNYQCKDGSVGGPVCAENDLGACGWRVRACPEEEGDGGQGEGDVVCGSRGSEPCPRGTYCQLDESCGATDKGGTCVAKPQGCTKIYVPVCGCDGKTYGNACTAASSGVSVASKGKCGSGVELCEANACTGPAPEAPNYQCKDGSPAGPICAKNDLGACGWQVRACPE